MPFASYAFNLGNTSIPTSTLSVYNTTVNGSYTLTKGTKRFSSKLFLNKTNDAVLMDIKPNAAYNGEVSFWICDKNLPTPTIIELAPEDNHTYAITATGLWSNHNLYLYALNNLSSTVNGTINITGYNE